MWELLAGVAIVALASWLASGAKPATRARLVPALALGFTLPFAFLPGTSVRSTLAFDTRGHGAVRGDWNRVDTPVADLRGACAWLRPRLAPGDRVVATDWLTTYAYLKRVDGWARGSGYGWQAVWVDGVARDCYINAELLIDLPALRRFAARGPTWVVAGGQELFGSDALVRPEVRDWLLAQPVAFLAGDGETRVIRLDSTTR
jgi:hypothetical protein